MVQTAGQFCSPAACKLHQLLSQLVQKSAGRCSRDLGNKLREAFWKSTPEAVPGEEQWSSVVQPGCLDVLLEEWVFPVLG